MTERMTNPGAGDYYPETGGSDVLSAQEAERPGLHVGTHKQELVLSGVAVVLAAVGALLIAWPSLHIAGSWISLGGILTGFYAQLTSDTREERMINVVAIGVAAVAFAMNLHHGGLY